MKKNDKHDKHGPGLGRTPGFTGMPLVSSLHCATLGYVERAVFVPPPATEFPDMIAELSWKVFDEILAEVPEMFRARRNVVAIVKVFVWQGYWVWYFLEEGGGSH